MVTGSLKDYKRYTGLHKHFDKILELLANLTPDSPTGKTVIEEGNAWVSFSKIESGAKETADPKFEAHRNFIDIHCIIKGEEIFGYADVDDLTVTKEYDPEGDYLLGVGPITPVRLGNREFIITFPEDAHIPQMKKVNDDVTYRALAKIRVED